jgi:hypothetical protein
MSSSIPLSYSTTASLMSSYAMPYPPRYIATGASTRKMFSSRGSAGAAGRTTVYEASLGCGGLGAAVSKIGAGRAGYEVVEDAHSGFAGSEMLRVGVRKRGVIILWIAGSFRRARGQI